jgi:hypothetical protein
MNIEELTIGDARKLAAIFNNDKPTNSSPDHPFKIGAIYLIRTVTMCDTGRIKAVYPTEIVLEDAAWIADTGRFSNAVAKAEFGEVEPFPDGEVIIGRGSIIDAVEISKIQRSQK